MAGQFDEGHKKETALGGSRCSWTCFFMQAWVRSLTKAVSVVALRLKVVSLILAGSTCRQARRPVRPAMLGSLGATVVDTLGGPQLLSVRIGTAPCSFSSVRSSI